MYYETTALQRVLQRLDAVHTTASGFMARCPAHDDRVPSLSIGISRRGRGVLLHCFAGCCTEDVLAALGLTYGDLIDGQGGTSTIGARRTFPSSRPMHDDVTVDAAPSVAASRVTSSSVAAAPVATAPRAIRLGRPDAVYTYVDEFDNALMQVRRWEHPDGKIIRQRRPDGRGGWIHNVAGVRRVLYRLPEVLSAAAEGRRIYLVEGEKNVEDLRRGGLVATTNPHGAGTWNNHAEEYRQCLEGAMIVILSDNDEAGRGHRRDLITSLRGYVADLRVVDLPGQLREGDDISDWLARGGTIEELERLADATPGVR